MSTNIKFVKDTVSWLEEIETKLKKYDPSLRVILNNFYSTENWKILLPNDDHIKLLKDIESLEMDIIECDTRIKSLRTDAEDGKESDILINKVNISEQCRLFNYEVDFIKRNLNQIILMKRLFSDVDEIEEWLKKTIILVASLNEDTDDNSKNEIANRLVESKIYLLKAEFIGKEVLYITMKTGSSHNALKMINKRVDSMETEFSNLNYIVRSKVDLAVETCRQFENEKKSIQILENLRGNL